MRRRIRDWFMHRCNAVHVFCRLKDCGLPEAGARRASAAWEWLYRRPRVVLVALATGLVLLSCSMTRAEALLQARWCPGEDGPRPCLVQVGGDGGDDAGTMTLAAARPESGSGHGY